MLNAGDEAVDLFAHRIEIEARARGGRHSEPHHQRLRAVVTCADRDAFPVEHLRNVVGVDPLDVEREDPGAPLGRRPVAGDPLDLPEPVERVHEELVFVRLDRLQPDLGQVVDGRAEADGLGDRGRTGLELVGQLVPACAVELDGADHLAAEVERGHLLEELAPAPKRPHPARAAHLVRRDRDEVRAERLHVERPVRGRLSGVDDHDRAVLVRPRGKPLARVDRPERIRDEIVRDDLHVPRRCDLVQRVEHELAVVVERDRAELGSRSICDVLPRDEIRVMLELRHDDDIATPQVVEAPRVGDEVDALGRASREDHLALARRVQERRNLRARALVAGSGVLGELVDAAVDVRVRGLVEGADRVEDLTGLLCRRGGVEVRERLPVDLVLEDREVRAQLVRIQLGACLDRHAAIVPGAMCESRAARATWVKPTYGNQGGVPGTATAHSKERTTPRTAAAPAGSKIATAQAAPSPPSCDRADPRAWARTDRPMRRGFRGRTEGNERELVEGDLEEIDSCDAVLAAFTAPDEGTAMEAWYAHAHDKPVVVYTGGTPAHPWMVYVAASVHADLGDAVWAL